MEPNKKETVHRVGTITCGTTLIVTGILFLVHIIVPFVSYLFIFQLWPCILIMLGIEILIGNYKKDVSFVYDTGSIVILILLLLFAMAMAVIDYWIQNPYAARLYLY